jgi:hypothetical protein
MTATESRRVLMAIRIQLLILVFLPLLAAMMARGCQRGTRGAIVWPDGAGERVRRESI